MPEKSDGEKPLVARLAAGDWGKMGTGIGAIVVAAATWATAMKTGLDTALIKLDTVAERMTRVEAKFEKLEDRLLRVELSQRNNVAKPVPGRGEDE
jgi:hypothetical protein